MNFLLWYAIMRTPFFADRSVQNKSGQKMDCPSVDAPKKLYKNVFFWGLRKCIKNGIHDQRNNEIFRKSYSPKNQRFGWVIPVNGYIIFITSNRNYSKKCRSLRWIGNSKGITFLEFYGGWGVSDALSTLYCTHRVALFAYFRRLKKYFVHFLRHLFFWGRFLRWICQHFFDHFSPIFITFLIIIFNT